MLSVAVTLAALVTLARAAEAPTSSREYALARATANEVLAGTRALLEREYAEKGAAGALGACAQVALDEARRHEQKGWRVRRVSTKYRNPADAPDRYEARVLREFAELGARGALRPEAEHVEIVVEKGRPTLRYLRPVFIGSPLCLNCHGAVADLEPAVRDSLRARFPKDRAIGYRMGDLRGAVSVAIPVEGPQETAAPSPGR
jgi:hypothetical protein